MKSVCMLLNGDIKNDSRVIRVIETISNRHEIDLFYISADKNPPENLFNNHVRLIVTQYPGGFLKAIQRHSLFYNEFMFFVAAVLKEHRQYDFIYANDLPCLKPAVKLKDKLKAKLIYDSHEIYIETINQFFPTPKTSLKNILFRFLISFMKYFGTLSEKKLIKKTDFFITVGTGLKFHFENKYKFSGVQVMMNCPKKILFSSNKVLREKLSLQGDQFVLLYQGNINQGRGLEILIDSLSLVDEKVVLVIIGDGVLKNTLIEKVKISNLDNRVYFINTISEADLTEYTVGADVGVNLLEPFNLSKKLAAPNKMFQYIHAELPVIASSSFENNLIFEKYNVGKLVDNNSVSIANAINSILKEDLSIYKSQCRLAAEEYCWESQEPIIKTIIND